MRKIYDSFSDLFEQNKSLFKFFKHLKYKGALRAIWDARQGEVDLLKETAVEEAKEKREKIEGLEEKVSELIRDLAQRERILTFQREKITQLEGELSELQSKKEYEEEERKKVVALNNNLEQGLSILRHQLSQYKGENKHLEEQLETFIDALAEKEYLCKNLENKLQEKSNLYECVAKELEKNQAYIRTQKRLNEEMSDELLRAKGDAVNKNYPVASH